MFDVFLEHGRVLEVVISARKEGIRMRFGFGRFLDVTEPERMAIKLDNFFVESVKLHANLARFKRDFIVDPKQKK